MTKVFGWGEKFREGTRDELRFPSIYKGPRLTKAETRAYDFDREDGLRVELKSDQYPIEATPNFFIERWSVVKEGRESKPGSLWQSQGKADIFIYFFAKSGIYFEFHDLHATLTAVEHYVAETGAKLIDIHNKGYKGQGYRIPRHVLAPYYKEEVCRDT